MILLTVWYEAVVDYVTWCLVDLLGDACYGFGKFVFSAGNLVYKMGNLVFEIGMKIYTFQKEWIAVVATRNQFRKIEVDKLAERIKYGNHR